MLRLKDWFTLIVLPFALAWGVDRITKNWAEAQLFPKLYGPVFISVSRNAGIMLGGLTQWPELYRVTGLATLGAFLIYVFFAAQYLIPIKSKTFRIGLSVFAGSVLGNVTDRIFLGSVIDFIQVTTPFGKTGVFNVSDFLQWFGAAAAFGVVATKGQVLWPEDEQRGRKWIKPEFQWRYCMTYLGVGLGGVLVCGALFYAFLKITLQDARPTDFAANGATLRAFGLIFTFVTLIFSGSAFLVARHLSHRIAGPVFAFEKFLDDLIQGKNPKFQLREADEFQQFEAIASRFRGHFHEKLGMTPQPLVQGQKAPEVTFETLKSGKLDLRAHRGKKVWLCFYRYATCPLCADHFSEIVSRQKDLEASGIQVIAIFDSPEEMFLDPQTKRTFELLSTTTIPMVSDTEHEIYRLFRSRSSKWALIRPQVVLKGLQALKNGFMQRGIRGDLFRIPAHILIDREGRVHEAFYGKTVADQIPWETIERFMKS